MLAVWHILALALFIVAPLKGQTPLTCSVRGQCMTQGSFRLGEANATSQEECLQACQNYRDPFNNDCNWYSYCPYTQTSADSCELFQDCNPDYAAEGCYLGQSACEPDKLKICSQVGVCRGFPNYEGKAESETECAEACSDNADCGWYTFIGDATDKNCLFFGEDCPPGECNQVECTFGQSGCFVKMTRMMVVGGFPGDSHYNVEIIDLSNATKAPCIDIPAVNGIDAYAVGEFIDDHALICNAFNGNDLNAAECFRYEDDVGEWVKAMNTEIRSWGAGDAVLENGDWWITGGMDSNGNRVNTAQVLGSTGSFEISQSSALPTPAYQHVLVPLGGNSVAMVAMSYTKEVWISADISLGNWKRRDLPEAKHKAFAGLVTKADGTRHLVVAGGCCTQNVDPATTWIFDVDGDQEWRKGAAGLNLFDGVSLQYEDSVLAVGGSKDQDSATDEIWWFNVTTETWVLMEQKLTKPRENSAAFLIPHDYAEC